MIPYATEGSIPMTFIDQTRPPRDLTPHDMKRMRIGKRYWTCRHELIPDDFKYGRVIRRFLDDLKENVEAGYGILFYGDFASGKTAAATIIAKATVAYGGTALFIPVPTLTDTKIGKVMFDDEETMWERIMSVDVLILDEIGAEHGKDWGLLERIVRERHNECKSTIGTTNQKLDAFTQLYTLSFMTVLSAAMFPVHVTGMNWREEDRNELTEALDDD